MKTGIEIQNITKRYATRTAVDELSLEVREGEIFGFIGPNGAGKTTTLRILCGLLNPDLGDVFIDGLSVRRYPRKIKRLIGYMPDEFGVYPDLLTWEYLDFFASCYDLNPPASTSTIDTLLDLVDLHHRKFDQVDQLSRGMKQRLSLARVLLHNPKYLILDEPSTGLDPRARLEIRELLVELAALGKSIIFTSHILTDVSEICDRVGIIEAGKLVSVGRLEEMRYKCLKARKIHLDLLGDFSLSAQILSSIEGVSCIERVDLRKDSYERSHIVFLFNGDDVDLSNILSDLIRKGIPIIQFFEDQGDLEEVYMRSTKGQVS